MKVGQNHLFGTKGVLLYRDKQCMCILRGKRPGRWKSGPFDLQLRMEEDTGIISEVFHR